MVGGVAGLKFGGQAASSAASGRSPPRGSLSGETQVDLIVAEDPVKVAGRGGGRRCCRRRGQAALIFFLNRTLLLPCL
jgi:hypothetical protein